MAFEPFASVEDVERVWGEIPLGEAEMVDAWLTQASNSLRMMARKAGVHMDARLAGDELAAIIARDAVVSSVRRVLMNRDGIRQRATTTGPFTESETIDSALSTGQLYIAAADIVGLLPSKRVLVRSFSLRSGY